MRVSSIPPKPPDSFPTCVSAPVCGVIPEAEHINLISLLFSVMPAHILQKYPDAKTPEKRDECRADYVRRVFAA